MPLSLRIICAPEGESISQWDFGFPEEGGDIGRGYGVTMQLHDQRRELSARHAMIRRVEKGYQLEDCSTNGVYVNGSKQSVGRGNIVPLNDGDVFDLGRYRLLVSCFIPEELNHKDEPSDSEHLEIPPRQQFDTGASLRSPSLTEPFDPFAQDPFATAVESIRHSTRVDDPFLEQKSVAQSDLNLGAEGGDQLNRAQTQSQSQKQYHTPMEGQFEGQTEDDWYKTSLESDPFLNDTQTPKRSQINFEQLEQQDDSDPFRDSGYQNLASSARSNHIEKYAMSSSQYHLQAMPQKNEAILVSHQQLEKALEMAFQQFIRDISPHMMESLFDDLAPNRLFKPNYWKRYKAYFARDLTQRDWQVKFYAYFYEALRLHQRTDGGKK